MQRGKGIARLEGGGKEPSRVTANLENRPQHATTIAEKFVRVAERGYERNEQRREAELPQIAGGIPFLLQIPDEDDSTIKYLSDKLGIEIVAEYDDGYLIVATQDLSIQTILDEANGFSKKVHGTGMFARILDIDDDSSAEGRIKRIIGDDLWQIWPFADEADLTLDVSINTAVLGSPPNLRLGNIKRPELIRKRKLEHSKALAQYQETWEEKRRQSEKTIEEFVQHYDGKIIGIYDQAEELNDTKVEQLPDSYSARLRMNGRGFRDLILNFPSLFEVVVPDDIDSPLLGTSPTSDTKALEVSAPADHAPIVCVLDSGIQEGHRWISAAIRSDISQCFVPNVTATEVADYVGGGGHGTRVAGAVLFSSRVPKTESTQAPFWVANARVLDGTCSLDKRLFPPQLLSAVVRKYGEFGVRIYNHSINANCGCRTSRMSSWATVIDELSFRNDALFIQSAGNLCWSSGSLQNPGVLDNLGSGKRYPHYLYDAASRIANPAQSLQALTVGSIAAEVFEDDFRQSLAFRHGPSPFSRTGFGLWNSIKPEVVEFGGDIAASKALPIRISYPPDTCPELIRSTLHGGPALSRDTVGTSFAAPKVAHIAAHLQALFPSRSTQLYRALIVNSARWPSWVDERSITDRVIFVRSIGYGVPSLERATENASNRVTVVTESEYEVHAKEGLVFGVPIPEEIRRPGEDFNVRIDVTLAYTAEPRRTRKGRRGYLSVWLDWKASKRRESFDAFLARALKDADEVDDSSNVGDKNFSWTLGNSRDRDGATDGLSRRNGTVQKDWTVVKNYDLPNIFGVVVRGHEGWARGDQEATAKFSLVVSFEAVGTEVPIYASVQEAIDLEVAEIESRTIIDTGDEA